MDGISPILQALADGRYTFGIDLFAALADPSADDLLWAGQCLVLSDRTVEGLALLHRAREAGREDAAALVAAAHRFGGDLTHAHHLLAGLDAERLSPFGAAVAARERGLLLLAEGRLRDALPPVLDAWGLAAGDPTGRLFLPSFAAAAGRVLTDLGRDVQALRYLDAALDGPPSPLRAPLRLTRALAQVRAGRFDEAERDLDGVAAISAASSPMLEYARGLLARGRGLDPAAVRHFERCAEDARATGQPDPECFARLSLCALATARGDLSAARRELARARHLADGTRARAFLAWRQGALWARSGDGRAVGALEEARLAFEALGFGREAGLVRLHLAEVFVRGGAVRAALDHLAEATDARHALGGMVFAAELRALPGVHALVLGEPADSYVSALAEDWRALAAGASPVLTVRTLGGYGLDLGGVAVKLDAGVARTVEILAFLLERGEAGLEDVQAHVFADRDPRQARTYLHVARNALHKALPGLQVPYDRERRMYGVRPEGLRLEWDVGAVREGLEVGGEVGLNRALAAYGGPFLPHTEGPWAADRRANLEWDLVRLGAGVLEELHEAGRHAAGADLARRLLAVNPLEEGVNAMLVRAVESAEGRPRARAELDRVLGLYRREVGLVPDELAHLDRRLHGVA